MKRFASVAFIAMFAIACGDDTTSTEPDGAVGEVTMAWTKQDGQWVEVGPADWSCLGTPSGDELTATEITVSGRVDDFQNGTAVPEADVTAFEGVDFAATIDTATSTEEGEYSVTVPTGTGRIGFKVEAANTLDTFLLNQYLDPNEAEQGITLNSVSESTAAALPAFIGVTRTVGTGVMAGAIRDCNDDEVSGAIAAVSTTSGSLTALEGAEAYYFSAGSTELPTRHSEQPVTNSNGLFVVIEVPPASEAYLQVWGYVDGQDPAADDMTLLAEIAAPVLADSVITASIEPLRD